MYINNLSQQHKIPLFFAFLITLLLSVFAIAPRPINAQVDIPCQITNINAEVDTVTAFQEFGVGWYTDGSPYKQLIVTVDTIGCQDVSPGGIFSGETIGIAVYDRDSGSLTQPDSSNPADRLDLDDMVPNTLKEVTFQSGMQAYEVTYNIGDAECDEPEPGLAWRGCQYVIRAWPKDLGPEVTDDSNGFGKVSGEFRFRCHRSTNESNACNVSDLSDNPDQRIPNPDQQPWSIASSKFVASSEGNTGECKIDSVTFTNLDGSTIPNPNNFSFSESPQPQIKAVIRTSNCVGDRINYEVRETSGSNNVVPNTSGSIAITTVASRQIEIPYTVGEDNNCGSTFSSQCMFDLRAWSASGSDQKAVSDAQEIRFNCAGVCTNTNWTLGTASTVNVGGSCEITNVNITPKGPLNPAFDQENPATVAATIDVKNCKNEQFLVAFTNNGTILDSTKHTVKVETDEVTRLRSEVILGEEGCRYNAPTTGPGGTGQLLPWCVVRATVNGTGSNDAVTYDCDGGCNPNVSFRSKTVEWIDQNGQVIPIELTPSVDLDAYRSSLEASPCYVAPGSPGYDETKDLYGVGHLRPGCYGLLAPLPGLTSVQTPVPGDPTITATSLAQYVNTVLQIVVGIAGLLAVVMIVIAGVQYMTSNVVGVKGAAKDRIVNALIGLLIALSIFIILNTLNPNLLNIDPDVQSVQISVDPSVLNEPGFGVAKGQSLSLSCSSGINTIQLDPCDASTMTTITAFGQSVQVHVGVAASVQSISQQWEGLGGQNYYPINYIGGYACRDIAGTNRTSAHAFGMAIDINKDTNPHDTTPPIENTTDMNTVSPSFYSLWKNAGWGWGGDWTSSKDPMHFSRLSNEGGNQTIDGC